jgi:hypothetical protein
MRELMFDMEIAPIIQPVTMVLLKPLVAVNIKRSSPISKPVLDAFVEDSIETLLPGGAAIQPSIFKDPPLSRSGKSGIMRSKQLIW